MSDISKAQENDEDDGNEIASSDDSRFVEPGLHLFACDNPGLFPYVTWYLCQVIASDEEISGVPYRDLPVGFLMSGRKRMQKEFDIIGAKIKVSARALAKETFFISELPIDWTAYEGSALVLPHLSPDRYTFVQQSFASKVSAQSIHGLGRLDNLAQKHGARILMIASFDTPSDANALVHVAREVFKIELAERDPSARLAWTIGNTDLEHRRLMGAGLTFVQVKPGGKKLKFVEEPYISKSLRDRLIWKCLSGGLSLAEAGKVAGGLNKSNVSRHHRDQMPRLNRETLQEDWWHEYEAQFAFTEKMIAKLKK